MHEQQESHRHPQQPLAGFIPPQPPTQQHLEQVVPSPFEPFGPFGSFGSFLHGVTAERAANLLPPGERVVFLPRQLRGAVFVFLSLSCLLAAIRTSFDVFMLLDVRGSIVPCLQLPVPWGRAVPPSRPWQNPRATAWAQCLSRTPPPSALQSPGDSSSPAQLCQEQT